MKIHHATALTLIAVTLALLAAYGMRAPGARNPVAGAALPEVSVATVVHQHITEWDEFTGRLEAPETVELRPRVSGYVARVAFEEGAIVRQGDLLFQIDDRPFSAEVVRLEAELISARSEEQRTRSEFERARKLAETQAMSRELRDNRRAAFQQAEARVQAVAAALDYARLQLEFTRVTAPIDGRVSNALVTQGNYVNAGQSLLTTIVSTDRIYAYFDADEQTYLKYAQLARQGARPSSREARNPVYMALAGDRDYVHMGYIDFVDNQVNPQTGTIRGRAVFDNSDQLFVPGLFARIKLVGSANYEGILIDDKAIGTDLNKKFVLVLDKDNVATYRRVTLGEKLAGLRIIKSGLQPRDKIVVKGLQRVRPGSRVAPQQVDMADAATMEALAAMQQRSDYREPAQLYARSIAWPTQDVVGG